MKPHAAQFDRPPSRRGFTMIELLIVLAIIGILLSISFVVYGAAVENAREAATKATIRQLDSALQERLNAFHRVNLKSQAQQFKSRYDASGANTPTSIPPKIAEIIVRKDRFRAAFPQRLEDLWGFDGVVNTADDAPLWSVWKRLRTDGATNRTASAPDPLESSELLYLALTNGGSFGAPVLPLDRIRASHVRDVNNNGLNEIYDEWEQPLRFYNWPTRLVRPGGETSAGPPIDFADIEVVNFRGAAVPLIPSLPKTSVDIPYDYTSFVNHPLNIDPDDPTGSLLAAQNTTNVCRTPYALNAVTGQQPVDEKYYGTFDTYSVPLIVSAGPDGQLGLNEPAQAGAAPSRLAEPLSLGDLDPLYDNITNRQP